MSVDVELIHRFESPIGDAVELSLFVAGAEPFPVRLKVIDDEGIQAEAWLTPDLADWIAARIPGISERARRDGICP